MKAVVLAGGEGTRLRPLTENIPKPLIPVAGRPCVEYALRSLVRGGFREIVITTGYLSDRLVRSIGDGRAIGASVLYSFESVPAGTAGAVRMVHSSMVSPFIVMSGDQLIDIDTRKLYEEHVRSGADVTMALTEVGDTSEFGVVATDEDGFVTRFQEKPKNDEAFSHLINAGAYVINSDVMALIPEGKPYDFSRQLFPDMLRRKMKIGTYRMDGIWLDIGRPSDLLQANAAIVAKEGKEAAIAGCMVSGRMIMAEKPVCGNDVEFSGNCYIGKGVVIEDRNTIMNSALHDGVTLGSETRVVDSLLLDGARTGKNCDIRESILSPNCRLGDNVKLEKSVIGEHVFIKGNSSLIGANISPHGHHT
ncbi:MAG: NDP-sugar synthase [Thermoplasmata archaeon]|nr:NDP-sugar synthase [Candidatus Sysuiplasma acidicola]